MQMKCFLLHLYWKSYFPFGHEFRKNSIYLWWTWGWCFHMAATVSLWLLKCTWASPPTFSLELYSMVILMGFRGVKNFIMSWTLAWKGSPLMWTKCSEITKSTDSGSFSEASLGNSISYFQKLSGGEYPHLLNVLQRPFFVQFYTQE